MLVDLQAEQQGQVRGQRQLPASFRQRSKTPQAMRKDSAEYVTITRNVVKMIASRLKLSVAGSRAERIVQFVPRSVPAILCHESKVDRLLLFANMGRLSHATFYQLTKSYNPWYVTPMK